MRPRESTMRTANGFDTLPWPLASGVGLAVLGLAALCAGVAAQRIWVLLVFAPLAEEACFRAGLQEALHCRLRSPSLANSLTALAFGIAHAVARSDPGALWVALPALLVGAVYARSRRVLPCVALHAAMNALWLGWTQMSLGIGLGLGH